MEGLIRRVRLMEEGLADADAMAQLEEENSNLEAEVKGLKNKVRETLANVILNEF